MTAVLSVSRHEIEQLFVEIGCMGSFSLVFLTPEGEPAIRWPNIPTRPHGAGAAADAVDCLRLLAPMVLALTPSNSTLSWMCPHGVEFAVSGLFVQSAPARGGLVVYGEPNGQALPLTRVMRLHLQQLIDLQQEMENLSNEIARNYEELNLHYELSAKLDAHPSPAPSINMWSSRSGA